ncbi:nucleoside diphosphate-linked moiety X motif 17 isoform X2 [Moschus berezovskii]|uniref:nucleoside diphosphate-linked moiety X motif 17 isoform X2 n=1 Tax=Moschus berezovskii TaxID=68408 RepID=UPI0024451974|nr:nucleoside diphosphate-linked moiety X motif 17 isoform X2 [Moschus berezovskii]
MAAARVLLLLSGRPESVSFAQSVCGLLSAGSGLGPWPTHCGLRRGQLVLSDKPFPGASARLPLQRPPFCPFAALDQQPRAPGVELPPNGRGVDLGVAVILQSSDQTVLLTRRTSTLKVSPNLWVPPGGHVEPDEEVTDQLSQTAPSAEGETLSGTTWGVGWGKGKRGTCRSQALASLTSYPFTPSCWMGGFESFGRRVDSSCPRASSPGSLWGYGSAVELKENGGAQPLALPTSTLLRTTPAMADSRERVSTGTKFALTLWLQHLGRQSRDGS